MTIVYPGTLPLPIRDGYEIRHVSPMLRTELASGRARQRRKYTTTPSVVSVKWRFTAQQAVIFEEWFNNSLVDGANWFLMTIRTQTWFENHTCRFIDIYDGPRLVGKDHWEFTAELETTKRTSKDLTWKILPQFGVNSDIFDLAANREMPQ